MARTVRGLPDDAFSHDTSFSDKSNGDTAYRRIKAAIIEGKLPPGLEASEQQLALRLGMSRTPVHQALVRLETEDWLEMWPRRGVRIAYLSAGDMKNIYETLMVLEVAAVTRLASRELEPDDELDTTLMEICRSGDEALEYMDLRRWAEADRSLHTMLVDNSGNPHLARFANTLMEKVNRARLATVSLRPPPASSNREHKAIIDAIANRMPGKAKIAMEQHRRHAMATLIPILESMDDK